MRHIRESLKRNNYPDKLVREYVGKCKNKINNDSSHSDNNNSDNSDDNNNNNISDDTSNKESKSSVVIPYKEGTSET
ncbi:unnamed protein product [Trichobilharzia regenti]|nr:unnamed protein product [Trichobilharzia regenti]